MSRTLLAFNSPDSRTDWFGTFTRLTTKDRKSRPFLLNSLQEHWRQPF
jgi:hypothetical protein